MIEAKEWLVILPPEVSNSDAANYVTGERDELPVIFEGVTAKTFDNLTQKELPILTVLEAWKTFVGVELVTVPKLIGAGSYIESKHLAEREFSFTVKVKGENVQDTEETTDNILKYMMKMDSVKFHRFFLQDGEVTKQEILDGYLTGFTGWEQYENHAFATFSARCPDPDKTTIKLNKKTNKTDITIGI